MINNDAAVELVHVVNPSGGSGESYTAGAGITISDQNEIGIDQSVVATKAYVSQEIGTVREVPEASSADSGKVLGVTDSEGTLGWVANGGGASYTAGTGIDITNDTISVDTSVIATQNDLSGLQPTLTAGDNISISNNTISATDTTYTAGTGLSLTGTEFAVDTTVIATKSEIPVVPTVDTVYDATSTNPQAGTAVASAISTAVGGIEQVPSSTSSDSGKVLTVDSNGDPSWVTPSGGTQYSAGTGIDISAQNAISVDTTVVATKTDIGNVRQVPTSTSVDFGKVLGVTDIQGTLGWVNQPANELPSISGNSNKVLKVNAGGTAVEWATESTGTTYTAGNMISLANNAVAVSTTAGITDIRQVAALPANPVATVLYLIPEA